MGLNLVQKILKDHLVEGSMKAGEEIAFRIDHTLTQDATGTMAFLEFEAMGIPRVKCSAVSYVDHNMLQSGFENAYYFSRLFKQITGQTPSQYRKTLTGS